MNQSLTYGMLGFVSVILLASFGNSTDGADSFRRLASVAGSRFSLSPCSLAVSASKSGAARSLSTFKSAKTRSRLTR